MKACEECDSTTCSASPMFAGDPDDADFEPDDQHDSYEEHSEAEIEEMKARAKAPEQPNPSRDELNDNLEGL